MRIISDILRQTFKAKLRQRQVTRSRNIGLGTASQHLKQSVRGLLTLAKASKLAKLGLEAFLGNLATLSVVTKVLISYNLTSIHSMSKSVAADTRPLIALALIEQLPLLKG